LPPRSGYYIFKLRYRSHVKGATEELIIPEVPPFVQNKVVDVPIASVRFHSRLAIDDLSNVQSVADICCKYPFVMLFSG